MIDKIKEEMKEMSKKELAEKMFNEGIYLGFIGALTYPATQDEDNLEKGND